MRKIILFLCSIIISLLPGFIIHVSAQVAQQDSLTLVALYDSTYGESWTNNTNWLTGEPVSTWYGVTASNNRITMVNLTNNNLDGVIPPSIGDLDSLEYLSFYGNQLSDSIPPEIGNLAQLTKLNLHTNQLSGSIPAEIGNLTELEYCYLNNNLFLSSIPEAMNHLSHLVRLSLGGNMLSGSVPFHHDSLPSLDQLQLENNQLDQIQLFYLLI